MNRKNLLVALLLLASPWASACGNLQGAWELAYAVYTDKEGKVVYEIKGDSDKSLKILSQNHFSFITQRKDKSFAAAGAGTWSVEDNQYTEVVSYASLDRLMNKTYEFNCQLKDGTWIHSGDEDGIHIEEHWRRAK